MTSHSHAKLDQEHRCVASKCKGKLAEPATSYGHWAYWRKGPSDQWGWYATPSTTADAIKKEFEVSCIAAVEKAVSELDQLFLPNKRTVRKAYEVLGTVTSMFDAAMKMPKALDKRIDALEVKFEDVLSSPT